MQGLDLPQDSSPEQLKQVLATTMDHNRAIIEKLQFKISPE